jgi:hypothetical protein
MSAVWPWIGSYVRGTASLSPRDTGVGWQASIYHHTPNAKHFEVNTTHLGFGHSPEVFKLLAARLGAIS